MHFSVWVKRKENDDSEKGNFCLKTNMVMLLEHKHLLETLTQGNVYNKKVLWCH